MKLYSATWEANMETTEDLLGAQFLYSARYIEDRPSFPLEQSGHGVITNTKACQNLINRKSKRSISNQVPAETSI